MGYVDNHLFRTEQLDAGRGFAAVTATENLFHLLLRLGMNTPEVRKHLVKYAAWILSS
jgi:hypothetical protein